MGFAFGFLIGAGIAAVFAKVQQQERGQDDAVLLTGGEVSAPKDVMSKIKQQMREANEAARQAALEKQSEMLSEYEATVRRKPEQA